MTETNPARERVDTGANEALPRLWSRIAATERHGYEDDIDLTSRFHLVGYTGYWAGLVTHVILAPLFYVLDYPFLAGVNAVGAAVFGLCLVLNRRGEWPAAFALGRIEVCVHSILSTLILGIEAGFFLFLLLQAAIAILGPMREFYLRVLSCFMFGALAAWLVAYVLIYGPSRPLPVEWAALFLVINTVSAVAAMAVMLRTYDNAVNRAEAALSKEYDRSEALLANIMPSAVSARLKLGEEPIANSHAEVTVLFADIVGFTERSARMTPEKLITLLNLAFTRFDRLVDKHGLEKIKTIGDAYMVVGGVPEPRADHARAIAELALEMVEVCKAVSSETGEPFDVRIGINSGPVVAGVIGETKLAYDLWGDVVNTASRMESHSLPGRIQITPQTRELLGDAFSFEPRRNVQIKGKGRMTTYFLTARNAPAGNNTKADNV